ncbi:hypothetical protein GOP47_0013983 [Adiantum capillus-veneris]|uniref:Pectinesterase n=1 Tax=Adiantum capillus-veneris TaxID=13818 RepID=A0A9D4UQ12_ADICA|nr:hypothetical protein GOP47_0013983 [Adiantum capillus-veneris]
MRSGKEQELSGSIELGGSATSHLKVNAGGGACSVDEEARASTSLEHWEAQSVDKAAQSSIPAFEEDDDRGLSRSFRFSIIIGSALIMLAVILCLVVVLPRSSHKSPKHDNSSKLLSWKHFHVDMSRQDVLVHPRGLLHHQKNQHHSPVHNPLHSKQMSDVGLAISPFIASACTATRFPDDCQASLVSDPSAFAATSVTAVADSAVALSRNEVLSLRPLAQQLLSSSDNVNMTTAAEDCVYLLGRAASFLGKSQAIPLAGQLAWQVADAQAWMSAALTYENDCRSALSYVNTSSAVDDLMRKLGYSITITSNALSMVDAYRAFGNSTSMWVPPTRLTVYNAVQPPSETASGDWWQKPALTVALDGSGDFSSVQAAIDAAPEGATTWYVIHVREGVYKEVVKIPSAKTGLALIGDGMGRTIITGNRNAQMPGVTTYDSATVAVDGDRFVAVGVTFENTAGPQKHQAVALRVDSDFAAFYNCSFLGFQDTLYVHSLRQFFKSCQIEGTIDFIFGNAAALFQECTILFRPGLPNVGTSVVTAQGRTDPAETCALVFQSCILNGTLAFLEGTPKSHSSYLGRPWKSFSRSIFLDCVMSGFFRPEGWIPWNGSFALDTLFYGEYRSSGAGGQPAGRVPWSTQLSRDMALFFTVVPFIQGDRWLPATNVPFSTSL